MKTYAITTSWGGRGTVNYVIGQCENRQAAYEKAIKGFKWFALEPDINEIIECDY